MLDENLTPDERGELLKLLRDTIAADRYPLSRRIRNLKSVLAKLDPQPEPVVEPLPPLTQQHDREEARKVALAGT
jgi:hypothetical protein